MSDQELRRLVRWTVQDPPPEARAGRALGAVLHLASTVVTLGADAASGARAASWSVPADPEGFLGLGVVQLRWPATAPAEQVQATRQAAWATSARSERPPRRLPIESWHVTAAVPGTGSRRPRHARAPWRLTVTDGVASGSLSGAWLALAWIGHLAGWPEPAASRG